MIKNIFRFFGWIVMTALIGFSMVACSGGTSGVGANTNGGDGGAGGDTSTGSDILPKLDTADAINVTSVSATIGGNITNEGTPAYTERGVCFSTVPDPTIDDNRVPVGGSGTGVYSISVTGLAVNTTYYVRAYAINTAGTAYSSQTSFTTSVTGNTMAALSTANVTDVTSNSTTLGGNITNEGTPAYTERGVCYGTAPDPTVANNRTPVAGSGTGAFSISVTGLAATTTYYARAYVINDAGTAYGSQVSFTTPVASTVPSLTGPSTASGSFYLTGTFSWPASTSADDHYELEYSYNSDSGYAVIVRGNDAERFSPCYFTIFADNEEAGKTVYFRVRAKSNGAFTGYSNVVSVKISDAPVPITVNATRTNVVVQANLNDQSPNNTSYPNGDITVGTLWSVVYDFFNGMNIQYYIRQSTALFFDVSPLIAGRNVSRAELRLSVASYPVTRSSNYSVAAFAGSWGANITGNTVPNTYIDGTMLKAPPASPETTWVVDVTAIVRNWASGVWVNNGFFISDANVVFPYATLSQYNTFYNQNAPNASQRPVLYIEFQ